MKKIGKEPLKLITIVFADDLSVVTYEGSIEDSGSFSKNSEPVIKEHPDVGAVSADYPMVGGSSQLCKCNVVLPVRIIFSLKKLYYNYGVNLKTSDLEKIQQAHRNNSNEGVLEALNKYSEEFVNKGAYAIYLSIAENDTPTVFVYSKQFLLTTISLDKEVFDKMVEVAESMDVDINDEAGDISREIPPGALYWCKEHAPAAMSGCSDEELWEYMKDTYNKFQ